MYQCIAVSRAGTGQANAQIVITGLLFLCVFTELLPFHWGFLLVTLHPWGRVLACWHLGTVSFSQSMPIHVTTYTLTLPGPCRGPLPGLMSITCLVFFQGDLLPAMMSLLSSRMLGMPSTVPE